MIERKRVTLKEESKGVWRRVRRELGSYQMDRDGGANAPLKLRNVRSDKQAGTRNPQSLMSDCGKVAGAHRRRSSNHHLIFLIFYSHRLRFIVHSQ